MHIILIHGQARTPLAMSMLAYRLHRDGHTIRFFSYAAFCQTFESITRRFVRTVRFEVAEHPYVIISHSLGGIIARASLPALSDTPPQHLVMLAPPNQPPLLGKMVQSNPLYRVLTQDCGQRLDYDAFYKHLPVPTVPTTIIAGTAGPRGRFSPFGEQLNDGVVSVCETELGLGFEVKLVPALHTFIMNSAQVTNMIRESIPAS